MPAAPRSSDVNAVVAGFLRDLSAAQASPHKRMGYKRAAFAVLALDEPLTELVTRGGLSKKVAGIGPSSTRVILEVLETGQSPIVEKAVAEAGQVEKMHERRRLRSNFLSRAAVRWVLRDRALSGPTLEDYRGDFQMHSEWSDGTASLLEMTSGCLERGYQYSAVTDHSHGLKIAGGMSMADAARQHDSLEAINARYAGRFRWLKGVEANIDVEGQLDLSADEAGQFEMVLAAPHAKLRLTTDQTPRLIRAIENPAVNVLAHPRGRVADTRAGIVADWDAVFRRAAALGVAVEIDGDPARQDLDYELAARALAAGCVFALDSDAHSPTELRYADTALAHARLAGIPPDRIVNCWALKDVLTWLGKRNSRR